MDDEPLLNELRDCLTELRGSFKQDENVIAKLRAIGKDRVFPLLRNVVDNSDVELRCQAMLAGFFVDPLASVELLVPMLADPEIVVRWHTCGLLHDIGDRRAIQPLIEVMKTDSDPQVRSTAAYALGGIGDIIAIPALIETMENDYELDELGYSASSCAATALDEIIKTNHTRSKATGRLCTMPKSPPNLALLKAQALKVYHNQ